jgi:glycosyltransferase involved in cell wall biosynthesis
MWQSMRVGYVPMTDSLTAPGDRRRFVYYARARGIPFEVATPGRKYDLVVLSERADLSVWARYGGAKIVFDFVDSYLQLPRTPLNLVRGLGKFVTGQSRRLQLSYWRALQEMCARADAVVCTTLEQKAAIERHCRNVHIVLDAHTEIDVPPKSDYVAGRPFNLVWEGLGTNVATLKEIAPLLRNVNSATPIALHIVTDPVFYRWGGVFGRVAAHDLLRRIVPLERVFVYAWNAATVGSILRACDLAVIPLPLNDRLRAGKPENKLLIMWRIGLPALVSASPAYARVMQACGLDGACADMNDWQQKLESYIADQEKRQSAGERGRAFAEDRYGEKAIVKAWDNVFNSLI